MTPAQFMATIPNHTALRDFFTNRCRKYCPPSRDMTLEFCKDVLAGKKHLLSIELVKWID